MGVCPIARWDTTPPPSRHLLEQTPLGPAPLDSDPREQTPPGTDSPQSRHPLGTDNPPHPHPQDTGNKRAVPILLECNLIGPVCSRGVCLTDTPLDRHTPWVETPLCRHPPGRHPHPPRNTDYSCHLDDALFLY